MILYARQQKRVSSSHQVAKVLELQLQQSLLQSRIRQVFQSPLFQEELDAGKMNDLTQIYKSSDHESWDMKSKVLNRHTKCLLTLEGRSSRTVSNGGNSSHASLNLATKSPVKQIPRCSITCLLHREIELNWSKNEERSKKLFLFEMLEKEWFVGEDSWESLGLQGDPTSPFWRRSALGFLWKEWC